MTPRAHSGDGRHIDSRLGGLGGEGSHQRSSGEAPSSLQPFEVWTHASGQESAATYYDRPVLKEPVWIWAVPAYFYAGGVAGAAVVLGEAAGSLASGADGLARRARWIGALGGVAGTALLIYDLGRPERFLHMLRVFRYTSPMSVGSWVLATAVPVFVASAVLPHEGPRWRRIGSVAGKAAAALGLPLAGYTAALLSTTAVPLWQAVRATLPVVFVASAGSSAAALLEMSELNETEHGIVRRFGLLALTAELAAMLALEKQAARVERVARPLRSGPAGALWRAANLAVAADLALGLLPARSRALSVARGVLGTVGSLALRFGIFHAGKASARDARATFEQQRS